jgi:ATPase subunit of ABC transporter with duplicated ATPase domains
LFCVAEAASGWTSKQDLIQVFGLRKVYRLPSKHKWWQFWKRRRRSASGSSSSQQQQQQQQQQRQYVAVADSWFGVPKGQLLCLLGPNGAGKTTTVNCLIGALAVVCCGGAARAHTCWLADTACSTLADSVRVTLLLLAQVRCRPAAVMCA